MLFLIAATVASAVGTYWAWSTVRLRMRIKGSKLPPGPKGLPLLGNVSELATSPNLVPLFRRWANEYGPIMQFSILGQKQVVLSSERAVQDLFAKRGAYYSDRGPPFAVQRLTGGLLPSMADKNETWQRERKFVHSVVSISATKKYLAFMADESAVSLQHVLQQPHGFSDHMLGYCYSVLTRSMFGTSVSGGQDPYVVKEEARHSEMLLLFRPDMYPSNLFPFLRPLPGWLVKSNAEIERLAGELAADVKNPRMAMKSAIANGTAKDSVLKHFLLNRDEHAVSDQEADYTIANLIAAGTRSPANGFMSYLYLMMKYPEWQQKVQDEIDREVGPDRLPTMDDIPRLPTVRAIVKEGIRFRALTAELGVPHVLSADTDDHYNGYFFEGGTVFHVNFAGILMDKEIYPDQQEFNPARWLDPSFPTYKEPLTVHPNCQNFAPFGYGRRACPGQHIGETLMVIMIARIAWACTIQSPIDPKTNKPIEPQIGFEDSINPKPLPFPFEIRPRDSKRTQIVEVVASGVLSADQN